MKRIILFTAALFCLASCAPKAQEPQTPVEFLNSMRFVDFQPVSAFVLDEHHPEAAKFSVIDMHSHPYAESIDDIKKWVETAHKNNVEKVIVHTYACEDEFDALYDMYKSIDPDLFELWCGFATKYWNEPDFAEKACAELERCYNKGAVGVGEIGDKGFGEAYCWRINGVGQPTGHMDDPKWDKVLEKCAELKMPINIHIGDPIWMYLPIDNHNDGFRNAAKWRIDPDQEGIADLAELVAGLERAMDKHPNTKFIACHFINISHDYGWLSKVMDRHPNLWLDNSARHAETAATPRATKAFYEKYQDRIFFGTDNTPSDNMYKLQWRVLETEDEHFYGSRSYHWALSGFGLSDQVLKKIYHDNSVKFYKEELGR